MAPKASRAAVKEKGKGKIAHAGSKLPMARGSRRSSRLQITDEHRIRPAKHVEKGDARPLLIRTNELSKTLLARRKLVLEEEEGGTTSGVEKGKEKVEVAKSLAPEKAARDLSLMNRLQKQLAGRVEHGGSVEDGRLCGDEAEEDIGVIGEASGNCKKSRSVVHRIPKLVADDEVSEHRFFDEEARQKYISYASKNVDPDKGFSVRDYNRLCISDIVEERGWQEFVKHPVKPASWELTREFYANVGRPGEGFSWVRGVKVSFKYSCILKAFKLKSALHMPGFFEPVKKSRKGSVEKRVELAEYACRFGGGLGGEWASNMEVEWTNYEKTSFKITSMSPRVRPWWMFYCSKVKPNCRVNRVPVKDFYAMYCMMKGLPINIGELIEDDIAYRASQSWKNLSHPHLIMALCEMASVQLNEFEMDLEVGRPISLLQGMPRKGGPVKTHIRGRPTTAENEEPEEEFEDYDTDDLRNSTGGPSAKRKPSVGVLLRRLHDQDKVIKEQGQLLDLLNKKMDAHAEECSHFHKLATERLNMVFPSTETTVSPPSSSTRPKKRGR